MNQIYDDAKNFLLSKINTKDAEAILEQYLNTTSREEHLPLSQIFKRILHSAQNSNMKAGVIGKAIDGFANLSHALFDFDPVKVNGSFKENPEHLLAHIVATLKPRGKIRLEKNSIWPKYCDTILSAATFLNEFQNEEDFYEWANSLYDDSRSMAALPLIFAQEIKGIGYPLACDFLKDLGFTNYGKPDVHIIEIFAALNLASAKTSPYQIQKVISKIARQSGVSAFGVDKVFWLIGSGNFYLHPEIGKIGSMKKEFIDLYLKNQQPT